jgi:hypothetical protein
MARKPNYNFERNERARLKAEKKAKRAAEKQEARDRKAGRIDGDGPTASPESPTSTTE